MVAHFLKIFLRSSTKRAGYTIINVSGLAIGLACSILILLWVWDETHFDSQHLRRDRVFQVMGKHTYPDGTFVDVGTSGRLAGGLREFPEVEQSCRLTFIGSRALFQHGEKSIFEQGVYADPSIFDIFTIPLVAGAAAKALADNNSIVISEKLAAKYFPGEDALDRVIKVNGETDFKVNGVFKDNPSNSSLRFDFIIPYPVYAMGDQYNEEWGAWTGGQTFVLLHPESDLAAITTKINKNITEPRIWPRWDSNVELFLFPLTDLRLRNNFNSDGVQEGGRIGYVRMFSLVGIFILAIACINFMNLATARSISRSKEIGVRKIAGAARRSLIGQFFSESILVSLIALGFSLVLVQLFLPAFNELTGKRVFIDYTNPVMVGTILSITLIAGLLAGSYPAFMLSSVKPVLALKGKFKGVGGAGIRKSLVTFQFALSTVLIFCAVMAHLQIQYMKNKDLGFDRENIVYFNATTQIDKNFDGFKNSALQNPSIVSIAQGAYNPMRIQNGMVLSDNAWPGKTKDDNIVFRWMQCDADYIPTLGLKIVAGRNFSKDNPGDSVNFIISEEAARQMKLSDPVGAKLKAPHEGTIIGVVKDFNSAKLEFQLGPVIMAMKPERATMVFVRYEAGKAQDVVQFVQGLYKKFEAEIPMEYSFMDAPFGEMYSEEILIEKLSIYFTAIAIFISCLGLFGLASFTAETRTKEIGVRKVLGASVGQIVTLLCRDFLLLIGLSLVIGLPIGWWGVDQFLSRYAFHTEMSTWVFVAIVAAMIGVTFISVGYQSAKAAVSNPVKTLRTE
jgi:ABC-type antimicrobial peptide transport system permease subunit